MILNGYYNTQQPFGDKGDYITAPKISNLFSEMIAIWIISVWENFGKPKRLNIVELGPGDGTLMKDLLNVFRKFPSFNLAKQIYMFETSKFLKKFQKKNINDKSVKWINNLDELKRSPVIFFGNEFFDAIPIKQFKRKNKRLLEKYYTFGKDFKIREIFKGASILDKREIENYKNLKNLNFIEYPKKGLNELNKIIKKILELEGYLLMIDYGFLKPNNQNTIQSICKHKRNNILKNLGKADITSHVNFSLIKEYFKKNNLSVKQIISQREFLESLGIKHRAEIIAKNMKFSQKSDLYYRLERLLNKRSMGDLFKVIIAYKLKTKYPQI